MSENYIAFISYRHMPLDSAVAARLHRMIEHFPVPKELRRDGAKHPGKVFRDRDELPLSSDLTAELQGALEHSEFLIVVCTPDTPQSVWVDREIEYFLRSHDRDNVLAVLVSGTQDESFPKRLTEIRGEDGVTVIGQVEPLAANISDDTNPVRLIDRVLSQKQRIFLRLRSEILRLMAAVLHCPYDTLRQRQKQYRQRQGMALLAVTAAIALVFVGMLANRNRIIREQMELAQRSEQRALAGEKLAQENEQKARENEQQAKENEQRALENEQRALENERQAQMNESYALALLSGQQLKEGDRLGAIESALAALPDGENDRPYRVEAEKALADALYVYQSEELRPVSLIRQPADIYSLALSDDGTRLITFDVNGVMRCYDSESGTLLWERGKLVGNSLLTVTSLHEAVLYVEYDDAGMYRLEDGEEIANYKLRTEEYANWSIECAALSPAQTELFVLFSPEEIGESVFLNKYDVLTGELLATISLEEISRREKKNEYMDGKIIFDLSGQHWAVMVTDSWSSDANRANWDRKVYLTAGTVADGAVQMRQNWEQPYVSEASAAFARNALFVVRHFENVLVVERYRQDTWERDYQKENVLIENIGGAVQEWFYAGNGWYFWWGYGRSLYALDSFDGTIEAQMVLTEAPVAARVVNSYQKSVLYLVQKDGAIVCSDNPDGRSEKKLPEIGGLSSATVMAVVDRNGKNFCLVSEEDPREVIYFGITGDPRSTPFASAFGDGETEEAYCLPNGKVLELQNTLVSDENGRILWNWVALHGGKELAEYEMHRIPYTGNQRSFSTDGTIMLLGETVLDTQEKVYWSLESCLPEEEQEDFYVIDAVTPLINSGNVLAFWEDYKENQIYVWEDPHSVRAFSDENLGHEFYGMEAIGNNGWVILGSKKDNARGASLFDACCTADAAWVRIECPNAVGPDDLIAVADVNPLFSTVGSDGVCRLFDLESGSVLNEWELPVSAEMIEEIRFEQEDSLLLVRGQGILYIREISGGDEWHTYMLRNWNEEESRLVVQTDESGKMLWLEDSAGRMTGLCLDRETLLERAEIPGLFCYLPETEQILYRDENEKMFLYPAYTLEQLIEQAKEILGLSEEGDT